MSGEHIAGDTSDARRPCGQPDHAVMQRFELFFHVADAALWSRDGSRLIACGGSTFVAVLAPED